MPGTYSPRSPYPAAPFKVGLQASDGDRLDLHENGQQGATGCYPGDRMAPSTSTIKYGAPALNEVVADLTGLLGNYLDPSPPGGLPKAQVLLAGVNERMVGIGRYIGEETRA